MPPSKSKSKSKHPLYPTPWTAWGWDEEHECEYRYRIIGDDKIEYDYEKDRYDREHGISSAHVPRTPEPESTGSLSENMRRSQDYSSPMNINYSLASTNNVTSSRPQQAKPQTNIAQPYHIETQDKTTKEEPFDPNYRVHHSSEFKDGQVFKVLWSEPEGSGGGTHDSFRKHTKYGEVFHAKVRRFVIVKAMKGHCICLPIMSYGQRGTTKSGVQTEHHAIIHTEGAKYMSGEEKNGMMQPIQVVAASKRHRLDDRSRLNYAKIYTVEHNVKVWFVGYVHANSRAHLAADYNRIHPPVSYSNPTGDEIRMGAPQNPANTSTNYHYSPGYAGGPSSSSGYSQHPKSYQNVATTNFGNVQMASIPHRTGSAQQQPSWSNSDYPSSTYSTINQQSSQPGGAYSNSQSGQYSEQYARPASSLVAQPASQYGITFSQSQAEHTGVRRNSNTTYPPTDPQDYREDDLYDAN